MVSSEACPDSVCSSTTSAPASSAEVAKVWRSVVHQGSGRHPGPESRPDVEALDQALIRCHREPPGVIHWAIGTPTACRASPPRGSPIGTKEQAPGGLGHLHLEPAAGVTPTLWNARVLLEAYERGST